MKRLCVWVTNEQHELLSQGTQTMTLQVQRILARHFNIDPGEAGSQDRVFVTNDGQMALPSRILKQLRGHADKQEKIAAIKTVRAYCNLTYGRSKKPLVGTTGFCSRFGLLACKQAVDVLWAEWGLRV